MSGSWSLHGVDLAALDRLAAALAVVARPGDTIGLTGDLGAGKTTLARALIAHVRGGAGEEIPSPTFALAQTYDSARMAVTHFDFYRLNDPAETDELGLAEASSDGLALIEWPERAAARLAADRLDILLEEGADPNRRRVTLTGHGRWGPRLARLRAMLGFLERAGWGDKRLAYLQGDASVRAYARAADGGAHAVLMDWARQPDGPPIRGGKPYSAIAHLAEDALPFVAVAAALKAAGFSTPGILAHDLDAGFLLIEDFGDRPFAREIAAGAPLADLYRQAVEVLVALRGLPVPDGLPLPDGGSYALPPYDARALGIEAELLLDWFWPALHGAPPPQDARAEYLALWDERFEALAGEPVGWVLRDYHSPNLMWLQERAGLARVGILDFQDALKGPAAYDLASLLQDARLDVPAELEAGLLDQYCARARAHDSSFDRDRFKSAYAVLGVQRSSKILGIFARLAKRDGKRAYLVHMPRVSAYLERGLAHPALARLKAWYDRHLPAETRARFPAP